MFKSYSFSYFVIILIESSSCRGSECEASCRGSECETSDDDGFISDIYNQQSPAVFAGTLVTAVNMAAPMLFTAAGSAPVSGSVPANFAGPPPGVPGGGIPPTAIANPTVIAGTAAFIGLGLVGVGPIVALFDIPRTNDNFAANAGIFEELNDQSRGKREIRKHLNSMAKFQSWIEETLERGLLNIFRYILYRVKNTLMPFCLLSTTNSLILL